MNYKIITSFHKRKMYKKFELNFTRLHIFSNNNSQQITTRNI
jgi:hypothetical protein